MLDEVSQRAVHEMRNEGVIWILKDEDGCVMLSTDDEDGVPVWSNELQAKAWASEEWSHCETLAIDTQTWLRKWTVGLMQDHLVVMINPSELHEEGVVVSPEELAEALSKE